MSKPNIVLFLPDQHRGDVMGCAGNAAAITPHLDRLASRGVLFERCVTNGPLCMPARASLMTGEHVNRHGVWGNNLLEADRGGPSHVRRIRDAGYHTAMFGKTHLYANHRNDGHTRDHAWKLHEWGYRTVHELRDVVPTSRCTCHYADFLAARGRLRAYQDYARLWWTGAFRGAKPWEDPPSILPTEEHIDMYCAAQAAQWIETYQEDKPFYLQVCFTGPHTPFDAPPEYRARFVPEDVPAPILEAPAEPVSPQVRQMLTASRMHGMTEILGRVMASHYYAKVSLIDDAVGLVIGALADAGVENETWIVYTSDHGEMLGDHWLGQKKVFYEGALRVPLIIVPPGGTGGWPARGLTDHLDVAATLLDAADAGALPASPGRSLLATVVGGSTAPGAHRGKDVVFSEVEAYYAMARDDRYKVTIDARTGVPLELYDMANDPLELENRIEEPGLRGLCGDMVGEYFGRLAIDPAKLDTYQRRVAAGGYRDTFMHDLRRQFDGAG